MWDYKYEQLEEGDIIKAGDEVDMCNDGWRDEPKWVASNHIDIGTLAPNPSYPSHRVYRRPCWRRFLPKQLRFVAYWLEYKLIRLINAVR